MTQDDDALGYPERSETIRAALARTLDEIDRPRTTLRQLLTAIGDHGPLVLCAVLTLPFLLPVSIPGVSTVFGLAIIFLAFGIIANRTPWLPSKIMDRPLDTAKLSSVLRRGLSILDKVDGYVKQRLIGLTHGAFANRTNGLAILAGGVLLLFPLGLVPFSNTLPAFAILFLSIGVAQRDGVIVLAGYGALAATVVYFTALTWGAVSAGRGLASMFGG